MAVHHSIHYVELPSMDNAAMKAFYGGVFGWTFEDFGPSYVPLPRRWETVRGENLALGLKQLSL